MSSYDRIKHIQLWHSRYESIWDSRDHHIPNTPQIISTLHKFASIRLKGLLSAKTSSSVLQNYYKIANTGLSYTFKMALSGVNTCKFSNMNAISSQNHHCRILMNWAIFQNTRTKTEKSNSNSSIADTKTGTWNVTITIHLIRVNK